MFRKEKKGRLNIDGERISYVRKRGLFAHKGFTALFIVAALVVFCAGAALHFRSIINATSEDITENIAGKLLEESPEYKALREQGHFNMLVLGEDDVEGSKRSDTILFVTVELDDKCVKVLALPRDTRVEIPGHGIHKLNSSFAYGGVELLKTTVENYLKEPILYYVVVNYDNFPKLVDAFGGVDIDVKKRMRYVDRAGHLDINFQPGMQHMDGKNALLYVRFRKDAQGDIGRVQRQQQFIKALLKKAYSPAIITHFPSIVSSALEVFQTNMPINLATALAGFAVSEFKRENIYMSTLYGEADIIDGLSFWIGDPAYGKRFINATLSDLQNGSKELGESGVAAGYTKGYSSASEEARQTSGGGKTAAVRDKEEILKTVQGITQPVAVLNGSGAKGISAALAKELQTLGVDVVYVGNAKHNDYMYTNISYPTGAASTISYPAGSGSSDAENAKKLGALLSVPDNLIRSNAQTTKVSVILGHDYREVFKVLESIKETIK